MTDTSPQNVTTTTTPPDFALNQIQGNVDIANNLANRGGETLPQAPQGAGQTQAQNQAGYGFAQLAGGSTPGQDNALAGAQNLLRYTIPQNSGSNVPQVDSSQINRGDIRDVSTSTLPQSDLSGYLNPFTDAVSDTTAKALNRQNQMALLNVDNQADTQGAYGGARQGLAQAETNRGYADTAANTLANLNLTNYTNAQNQFNTDQSRVLQANLANQGVDYNTAATNAGNSLTASQANASNALNLIGLNNTAAANTAGIQNNAVNSLINLGSSDSSNRLNSLNALYNYGTAQQGQQNNNSNVDYQNALNAWNLPIQNLGLRQNVIQGNVGSSTQQPVFSNNAANLLGLGVGGASLANSLLGNGKTGLLNGLLQ